MQFPFDSPSPAYVLARDGAWALVWLPRSDRLLWVDLDQVPFERLEDLDLDLTS